MPSHRLSKILNLPILPNIYDIWQCQLLSLVTLPTTKEIHGTVPTSVAYH